MGNKSSSSRGAETTASVVSKQSSQPASTITSITSTTKHGKKENLALLISIRDWEKVRVYLQQNKNNKKRLKKQAKMNQGAALRRAIERGAPSDIVLDLLAVYPKAASMADRQGKLPLHYECHAKKEYKHGMDYFSSESIRSQGSSSSGRFDDYVPKNASSCSSSLGSSWSSASLTSSMRATLRSEDHTHGTQVLQALLTAYPEGATTATAQECGLDLPLHMACRTRPPSLHVVEALLKAHPEAASKANAEGALPLHLAMSACENLPLCTVLFEGLIKAYPQAAKIPVVFQGKKQTTSSSSLPSTEQPLPLHIACQQGYPVGIVREFLHAYPEAASIPYKGAFPIHLACQHGSCPSSYTVRVLLEKAPTAAAMVHNCNGMLPLHVLVVEAWRRHAHHHQQQQHQQHTQEECHNHPEGDSEAAADTSIVQTMRVLLEAKPNGAGVLDGRGRLPLHYACMLDGIDLIVDSGASGGGGMTISTAMVQLVALLLKTNPQSAAVTLGGEKKNQDDTCSNSGDLPLHLLCQSIAHLHTTAHQNLLKPSITAHIQNLQAAATIFEKVLEANPHAASTPNREGRLPLQLVAQEEWQRRVKAVVSNGQQQQQQQQNTSGPGAATALSLVASPLASLEQIMNQIVKRLLEAYPEGAKVFEKDCQNGGGHEALALSWSSSFLCGKDEIKKSGSFSLTSSVVSVSLPPILPVLVE